MTAANSSPEYTATGCFRLLFMTRATNSTASKCTATRTYNLIPSPIRSVRDPSEVKKKEKNRAAEVKKGVWE